MLTVTVVGVKFIGYTAHLDGLPWASASCPLRAAWMALARALEARRAGATA